jgi:FAD/FMN-containing dehydrogenase
VSKIGHYLQEHITGEVLSAPDIRRHFATDGSILAAAPALVVYPHDENDVRKVARFSWQLAERNRIIPLTARGAGTDLGGAAIGNGVLLVFPAHMNRVIELDTKSGTVTVEPGIGYGKLQQTLMTHGRFLPPYPASLEYSTIGGAVANNASGERSLKYGDTREFVKSLRVVLANGEVITTGRINKRELNKKLGLATFEGEIYRSIDTLMEEKYELIKKFQLPVAKNTAGYHLANVKHDDGSIDLTPLLVGSQATLGIITEVTLETEEHNPETTLFVASFNSLQEAQAAVLELRKLTERPAAIEMIDGNLLKQVDRISPSKLKNLMPKPYPPIVLLVEFDDNDKRQKKAAKRAQRIFTTHAAACQVETELDKQSRLWKIRQVAAMSAMHSEGQAKALPIIDDGVVPVDRLGEFIEGLYELCQRNQVQPALWGRAGDGTIRLQPHLDLGQVGDRQKVFRLMHDYYQLVISLGGTTSGEYNDGRLRAPYLKTLYGEEMYAIFQKVKQIFDPYGMLNPGVKIDVSLEDVKAHLRSEYNHGNHYEHLPRS